MDMQKMQVRADLERMVYNYALLGKIENDTADKIVSFIGLTIGGGNMPEPCGRIIVFPSPMAGKQPEISDDNEQPSSWSVWHKNFEGIRFCGHHYRQLMILKALYTLRINSLEDLAKTPPDKIRKCHGIGEKSLEIIQSVLEKNGFTAWDIAL
jgi:hypothetical protein